ncbi:hypothetical protein SY91_04480 [Burkholderia cenocepacia]|nr:hypothetical protein SY91_04480 [Burkholderia cenocepacia]
MQTARPGPPVRIPDSRRAVAACLERLTTRRRPCSARRVPDTLLRVGCRVARGSGRTVKRGDHHRPLLAGELVEK